MNPYLFINSACHSGSVLLLLFLGILVVSSGDNHSLTVTLYEIRAKRTKSFTCLFVLEWNVLLHIHTSKKHLST